MAGHSKWSKVKHQKGVADIKKGQLFTKLGKAITIAVRTGGGRADPEANFKLRLAIEKARQANMPKINIEKAIERGLGKTAEAVLSEVTYEGFGPGKTAFLIKAVTDNRQRTNASLKNIFASYDGHLAGPGSVAYLFEEVGQLKINKQEHKTEEDYLDLALKIGSLDFKVLVDSVIFITKAQELHQVKENLIKQGLAIVEEELVFQPTTKIQIPDEATKLKLTKLVADLEANDDVQKVYVNFSL